MVRITHRARLDPTQLTRSLAESGVANCNKVITFLSVDEALPLKERKIMR